MVALGQDSPAPLPKMGWQEPCNPLCHPCCLTPMVSPWQEWQTGKHGATFCCGGPGAAILKGGDAVPDPASRLRGSGPPGEFSFPPDGGRCGLSIGMTDGGVCPLLSKAAYPWRWWRWPQQSTSVGYYVSFLIPWWPLAPMNSLWDSGLLVPSLVLNHRSRSPRLDAASPQMECS